MHRSLKRKPQARESGQTLILFTLFIIVLVLFVGLGVDLGFAYITRARLSKSVDAACLAGMRSYNSSNEQVAKNLAASIFRANYGTSGRDVGGIVPTPVINFGTTTPNVTIDVSAATTINTFFIRVLPQWKTLSVGSLAQATRPNLKLGLVLDRSGSLGPNGGMVALKDATPRFIDMFDDILDRASMSSFAYHARTDVVMTGNFKQPIKDKVAALNADGWTVSEQGLTNGWAQVRNAPVAAGEKAVKVIVFFTDGLANTWQYTFDCGGTILARNIAQGPDLYDPNTGAQVTSQCTIPGTIPRIDGAGNVNTSDNCQVLEEGQRRAVHIARGIRAEGIYIYSIGLGDPNGAQECGFAPLNLPFLRTVANENGVDDLTGLQPQGAVAVAANAGELDRAFNDIANKILARLTR